MYFSDGKSDRAILLTEECQTCIAVGVECLDRTLLQLLTGNITVAKLKLLDARITNFTEVFCAIERNAQSAAFEVPESGVQGLDKSAVLQKVILWRKREMSNLESMCRLISHFVAASRGVKSG